MDTVVQIVRVALALVLVLAAVGKLLDLSGGRTALFGFGVSPRLAAIANPLIPLAELTGALLLVLQPTARAGALVSLGLLLAFTAGVANVVARGRKVSCHCFGLFHSSPAGPQTIARNASLGAAAAFVAIVGPRESLSRWVGDVSASVWIAIGLGALSAGLVLVLWRERRASARARGELQAAQAQLEALPPGLPVGTRAPHFSLEEVKGGRVDLGELRARGLPVLVLFAGRGCMPTWELFPHVARWQSTLKDRLTIAVISWASPAHHDIESRVLGLRDIGLQKNFEVFQAYRVSGTPSAVVVSPDGTIASILAQGGWAIEALVRVTISGAGSLSQRPIPQPIAV